MPKSRLYKQHGQVRFDLYGKTHFVSSVNDRGQAKLDAILTRKDNDVEVVIEIPNYEVDSKCMIDDVACHVEYYTFPEERKVTLTEPTPMTFELLECSQEHAPFDLPDGALVFDDKGLQIFCYFRLGRKFVYETNVMRLHTGVVDDILKTIIDYKQGSAIPMMNLVESTELRWNSMQDDIENTEDFAVDYMEEFGEYVINTYVDGVPF